MRKPKPTPAPATSLPLTQQEQALVHYLITARTMAAELNPAAAFKKALDLSAAAIASRSPSRMAEGSWNFTPDLTALALKPEDPTKK